MTATQASELGPKIVRQVEYYFGDINLPRDRFLQEEMKKEDGWVELSTMLKFNRLSQLTTDASEIANALQDSDIVEVSEDKTKIRRSPEVPLPDNTLEYWQEIKRRTVYVKGFDPDTKLDEILEFLAPHGDIKNIVMRRLKKERIFKGSIFATFVDRETAEKFAKDESTKQFKDKELTKLMQDEYWVTKVKETKEKRLAEKQAKLQKKLEQLAEQEQQSMKATYEKGAVLEVSGLNPETTKYDELKTFFKAFGPVAFVAYETGNETARIRFGGKQEGLAKTAWEAALKAGDGKVVFNEKELTGHVLEGEEEDKYWQEFSKNRAAAAQNNKQGNRQKGGQKGGQKGKHQKGGRGKRSARDDNGAGAKKPKRTVFDDEQAEAQESKTSPTE